LVSVPSRQGGAGKVRKPPTVADLPWRCSAGCEAAAAFWSRALTTAGAVGPVGPSDGLLPRLPFCFDCSSRLGLVGGRRKRRRATRPYGRGDSNTKVNPPSGVLTRRTRPQLLPRHRESSNRVLWLVSVPSRQGGAGKVRKPPTVADLPWRCSAGCEAAAAFWSRALTTAGAVGPVGPSDGLLPRLPFCFGCSSRLGLVGGRRKRNEPHARMDAGTRTRR
jgi:hypothetical protein